MFVTFTAAICNLIFCHSPRAFTFPLPQLFKVHPSHSPCPTCPTARSLELKYLSLPCSQICKHFPFHANCSRMSVRLSQPLQAPVWSAPSSLCPTVVCTHLSSNFCCMAITYFIVLSLTTLLLFKICIILHSCFKINLECHYQLLKNRIN